MVNCNSSGRFRPAAIVQFAEIFSFERFYARLRRVFQTVDDILANLILPALTDTLMHVSTRRSSYSDEGGKICTVMIDADI